MNPIPSSDDSTADEPVAATRESETSAEAASPIRVNLARSPRMLFFGLGLLVLTIVAFAAMYLANPDSAPSFMGFPVPTLIGGVVGASIGVGVKPYIDGHLLTYDSQTRTIRARDLWGLRRTYPRKGFDRLEFAAESGRIFQVRPDGNRRRVPVGPGRANGTEWRRFIDQFERDHRSDDSADLS